MTQRAEPRFYKVEFRAMENHSQGIGLSPKRETVTCITPNFRILWTNDHFVPLIFPFTNAGICCGYPLIVSPFNVV